MTKKMNEKLFRAVKIMIAGGGTVPEIADYFSVSEVTVKRVKQSENLNEYWAIIATNNNKKKPAPAKDPKAEEPAVPVVEHRQTVTIQATHYMMQEMQKTNELLNLISRKLAFIVDALS